MKYILRTTKTEKGNLELVKVKEGTEILYTAKNSEGMIRKVNKVWVQSNIGNILNASASDKGAVYPIKPLLDLPAIEYVNLFGMKSLQALSSQLNCEKLDLNLYCVVTCAKCGKVSVVSQDESQFSRFHFKQDEWDEFVCADCVANSNVCDSCYEGTGCKCIKQKSQLTKDSYGNNICREML